MIDLRLVRPPLPAVVGLHTDGELLLEGVHVADTREDPDRGLDAAMSPRELRARKVINFTAIPTGRYRLALYRSSRYGADTLALLDVPAFFGVLIHADPVDSEELGGNILVDHAELADVKRTVVPRLRAGEEAWLSVERVIPIGGVTDAVED